MQNLPNRMVTLLLVVSMICLLWFPVLSTSSVDYCQVACQIEGSSTQCQNQLTEFDNNPGLPIMFFFCCMGQTNSDFNNYTASIIPNFWSYLLNSTTDSSLLETYAKCLGYCAGDYQAMSKADCDSYIAGGFAACSKQAC